MEAKFQTNEIVKSIIETSPDMLGILDSEGKVMDCNVHYTKNLGYQKHEVLGKTGPIEFVAKKDRQKAVSAFEDVVTKGIRTNIPLELVRKDKSTFPSIWSGAALHNNDGKIEGYIVTGKDLSEIQRLENKIQESEIQRQKEKMAIIGQLTSRIAHDIKNPLSVIQMSIELLKKSKKGLDDQTNQDKLNIISKNISRISAQVDFVLDFIRERPVKKEKVKLSECLDESIKNINIPENITINTENTDIVIKGDFNQLVVVFINMITNSIQALNGKNGTIHIKTSKNKKYNIIKVQDSGPGIKKDILDTLFDPLITTKQTGTGLGLASCKSIIESHKGTIVAKNNPTTFTIKLPKN